MNIDLDKILLEWSFRTDRGYPKITKSEDLEILYEIINEEYGHTVAKKLLENIGDSISEVSLGLNNDSLRHKNEHEKYTKRLVKRLKSGGKLEMEREVSYTEENEENSDTVTIPKGAKVKVDVNDDLIGKLVAALRGVVKYGPDFPEDSEKAQKALKRAEKVFTKDDGSYRRIIPVKYKGTKVLIKLSDVSKNTVTDEDEGQDTDYPPEADDMEGESKPEPSNDQSENVKQEDVQNDESDSDESSDLELPSGVVEYFGDSYSDGPENPEVMNEDSESDDAEEDTDKKSKYVDRRDDGKDTEYPDREYKEFDPKSSEEEEAGDDDYRQDNGDEEEEETEEGGEEEEVEELNEQVQPEKKKEIYKFSFEL